MRTIWSGLLILATILGVHDTYGKTKIFKLKKEVISEAKGGNYSVHAAKMKDGSEDFLISTCFNYSSGDTTCSETSPRIVSTNIARRSELKLRLAVEITRRFDKTQKLLGVTNKQGQEIIKNSPEFNPTAKPSSEQKKINEKFSRDLDGVLDQILAYVENVHKYNFIYTPPNLPEEKELVLRLLQSVLRSFADAEDARFTLLHGGSRNIFNKIFFLNERIGNCDFFGYIDAVNPSTLNLRYLLRDSVEDDANTFNPKTESFVKTEDVENYFFKDAKEMVDAAYRAAAAGKCDYK
jgi:hypothetical protein